MDILPLSFFALLVGLPCLLLYGFSIYAAIRRPDLTGTHRLLLLLLICTVPFIGPIVALFFIFYRAESPA